MLNEFAIGYIVGSVVTVLVVFIVLWRSLSKLR